jgi:fibronectin type 3 domain-containing protein
MNSSFKKENKRLLWLGQIAFLVGLVLLSDCLPLRAQTYLDTIVFGNAGSETAHSFAGPNTSVISNTSVSPTQTARRGLTNNPVTIYGGSLTFNLTVDPVRRNYFSIKLWGSDEPVGLTQDGDMGRLYLYVPATNFNAAANATNFYQVGYRHEGDYDPLNAAGYKPPVAGRFFYSTTLLPLWMTQGRTSLTLTIQPGGRIYDLGSGGPPSGNYQFNMITNSRGIYQAYTHTEPVLNPVGEVQGTAPATTTRPNSGSTSGVGTMSSGGAFWNKLNSSFSGLLTKNPTNFATGDVLNLALGYSVTNFPIVYTNPTVVTQVIAALDFYATNYYANPSGSVNGWGGNFGNLGWAIDVLSRSNLLQSSLDVTNTYGAGGSVSRRQAWGDMLLASRDYGRFNRNTLANQNLIANENIYWANRGLLDLTNVNAFSETNGQRYLREAIGLEPWLGSDTADGGHTYQFGTNYYMITPKGLSREWGYVGYGYGEMQFYAADFYEWTTNNIFLAQCVKMAKARGYFRRSSVEVSGSSNYRSMEAISILAWRGASESDSQFASEISYGDRTLAGNGMRCAAVTMDTNLIGYAKQMLNDGEYFYWLQYVGLGFDSLKAFGDYQKIAAATDSGVRLPATDGQPDFAWADEDNGIVAVKRGNEKLWLSTYWHADNWTGINGIGRFLYETNSFARYGVLEVTPLFDFSGSLLYRPNYVDLPYKTVYTPPDNLTNAYFGERAPLALSDPLANDNEAFAGKANFWQCRYGNFLIGINRSAGTSYQLKTPSDFVSATNLITGANMSGTVVVGPRSTVILYLNSATDSNPLPMTPMTLNAVGSFTPQIALDWNPVSGALGYNVKRSPTKGGPYTTIANVTGTNYVDTSVTIGGVYYYVISATNTFGESVYNSMEGSASAGLPLPWQTVCVGTPYLAGGNADYASGTFTVTGNGSDIGGTSDSFQYVYQPMTNNDGSTIVRFASMQPSTGGDKIGIMMRASTNANSMAAFLMFDTSSGFYNMRFACRTGTGSGMSYNWEGPDIAGAPVWFKLQRSGGTTYTASFSNDGSAWTPVGTNTFSMTGTVLAGMVVCARFSANSFDTSTFDNVSVTGWSAAMPGVPTNLIAVAGHKNARLTWNASTNATSYNLKRATVSGGPYTAVGSSITTNFVDGGLVNGSIYYYVVSAFNGAESANSSEASVTPVAVPGIGAAISVDFQGGSANNGTPSSMTATEYAGQVVVNNWNTAAGSAGTVSSLAQSDGATTTASVTWACNNTWSTAITESPGDYRMMKGYLDNNSTTNTTVTVTNLPSAYTNNGYSVYVYCDGDNGSSTKTGIYSIGATSYTATDNANVNFSGTYVQANNSTGNYVVFSNLTASSFTFLASTASTRAPLNAIQVVANTPTAPTGLTAVAGSAQVTLNWNATVGATSYNLNRTLTSGSNYVTVANVAGTNTVDSGLSNGTNYYYVVSAVNAGGTSTNSVQVSARPTSMISPPLQMSLNAGQLQFTWPPDHTGWRLMVQTNNINVGLTTNWFTVGSSSNLNQISVPIVTTNGSVFYRLVYP